MSQFEFVKFEKVEMHLDTQFGTYEDFIKGNYSYSTDGGNTYVVNSIQQNLNFKWGIFQSNSN